MRIKAIRQYLARLVGKVQKVDLRQPIPDQLRIGPLTYGQWDILLKDIFQIAQNNSTVILAYSIKTLDELLAFDRNKAIALGMKEDPRQINSGKFKPYLDQRWQAALVLLPDLNRKAAQMLNIKPGKYRKLLDFSSAFLDLRAMVAKINLNEQVPRPNIISFNKFCHERGFGFLITQT